MRRKVLPLATIPVPMIIDYTTYGINVILSLSPSL